MQGSQLILILVILGFSLLQWVIKTMREQAEAKRIQEQRERRRQAASGDSASDGPNEQQLRELAARRQAQLRALRERQRSASTSGPAGVRAPTQPSASRPQTAPYARQPGRAAAAAGAPAAPPTARPVRRQPAKPASRPAASRRPQADQARQRRRDEEQARRQEEQREERERQARMRALRRARSLEARSGQVARRAASASGLDFDTFTRDDWRRAVIMSEVLSPPVSLRPTRAGDDSAW